MRYLFAILFLVGCAPRLLYGTEAGGIVDQQHELLGLQQGFTLAEAHCRQYGKIVRIVPHQTGQRATSFTCERPGPGVVL